MSWRDEAEQGLPSPRRNEPGHLRQDILDELADHLAFAAERERDRGAKTDAEIRQRVLEHFGNPMTIARKLWFDAMKETIMRDWIQTIVIGIMCVAVVGFMTLVYKQMQTTSNAMLSALNDRPTLAEDLYPSIEVHLHQGSIDGPPVEGVEVSIQGQMFSETFQTFHEITDSEGLFSFGPVRPGSYHIRFRDIESNMRMEIKEVLFSGEGKKVLHITVPSDADRKPISVDVPIPEFIDYSYQRILLKMTEKWTSSVYLWTRDSWVMTGREGLYFTGSSLIVHGQGSQKIRLDGFGDMYAQFSYSPAELVEFVIADEITFSHPQGLFQKILGGNEREYFRKLGGNNLNGKFLITTEKDTESFDDSKALYLTFKDWAMTKQYNSGDKIIVELPEPFLNAYAISSLCHWNQKNTDQTLPEDTLYILSTQNTGYVLKDTYELPWSSRIFNMSDSDQWAFFPQMGGYPIDERHGVFFHLPDVFEEVSESSIMKLFLALNFRQIRDMNNTLNAYWAYDFDDKVEKRISREPIKLSKQPFWELDMKDVPERPPAKYPTAMRLQTFQIKISSVPKSPDEVQSPSGFVIKWESAENNEADIIHGNHPKGRFPSPFIAVMQPIEEAMAEREKMLMNSGV